MTKKINCFSVQAGSEYTLGVPIQEGIALVNGAGSPFNQLGPNKRVPVESGYLSHGFGQILRAQLVRTKHGAKFVAVYDDWLGLIVRVQARELRFEGEPLAADLNFWPGGEGLVEPTALYFDNRDSTRKVQLFQLKPGESIYLIDERSVVINLACGGEGNPVISDVGVDEMVAYILSRKKETVREIDWALHKIKCLRDGGHHKRSSVSEALVRLTRALDRARKARPSDR
jgi:hypothetical protein